MSLSKSRSIPLGVGLSRAAEPGGEDPWGTAQRIHLETGIVGQHPVPEAVETATALSRAFS